MVAFRSNLWINALLFQVGWFTCVLAAAHDVEWTLGLVAPAILGWHLHRAQHAGSELALIALALGVGVLFESWMSQSGVIRADGSAIAQGGPAIWLVTLWALFATTLNVSMRWLRGRLLLAAGVGAVGGPLAYLGGAKLGALELAPLESAVPALALGWAIVTPVLFTAARRFDGYAST